MQLRAAPTGKHAGRDLRTGFFRLNAKALTLACALALFGLWAALHARDLLFSQDGLIRTVLSWLFALLVLCRPKPEAEGARPLPAPAVLAAGALGVLGVVGGLAFNVGQLEWLGIVLLLLACLAWTLPPRFARDILLSLLLVYWAHPLPGQVFGELQLFMQKWSVSGSERLLHAMNVRVWADGFALRTGFHAYDVPAACSGMRTATTAFLVALGLSILRRLRWYEGAVTLIAAVLQALALNILRLSAMVILVPRMPSVSGEGFLHTTTGIIVIGVFILVYLETRWWARPREATAPAGQDRLSEDLGTFAAPRNRWSPRLKVAAWVLVLAAAGIALGVRLSRAGRPEHRAQMIYDVSEQLDRGNDPRTALRAATEVINLRPHDPSAELSRIRLLLSCGEYGLVMEALDALDARPAATTLFQDIRTVFRAYALMGLNRLDDAAATARPLPERIKREDPLVAMILLRTAFAANDPDEVALRAVTAARWKPHAERVQTFHPYLRAHGKWAAIIDSYVDLPTDDPSGILVAIEACMNLNRTDEAASLTLKAIRRWPDDARLIEPSFYLSLKQVDGAWEDRFAVHLARCTARMADVDALYPLVDKCFQLSRPDVAWLLQRRMEAIEADHPALCMAAVRYGHAWFSFRKRRLGLPAAFPLEKIDLSGFFRLGLLLESWRPLCEGIPLGMTLALSDTTQARRAFLEQALDRFRRRDAAGGLSLPMHYEYAAALEMGGDADAARARLRHIATERPEEAVSVRVLTSEIYEREADWQNVYETLRGYTEAERRPQLAALLRLCQAQTKLQLGLAAMHTARRGAQAFPDSTQARAMLARTLMRYSSPEEALFLLGQPTARWDRDLDLIEAESLYRTERYAELIALCRAALLPRVPVSPEARQYLFLPPAELSAMWHRTAVPSPEQFTRNADTLRQNVNTAKSPFLRDLMRLWITAHEKRCEDGSADPDAWEACARDDVEAGTALHQLTLLLCRFDKPAAARAAAERAVARFPGAPQLWRSLIGLSGADGDVIGEARRRCPSDPDIWLAELVARTQGARSQGRDSQAEAWAMKEMTRVTKQAAFPPATIARAGDYLFRGGMREPATIAARDAVSRARRLLPAYALALKCALAAGDKAEAMRYTREAIDAALQPPLVLYRTLVQLKVEANTISLDSDVVEALKQLRANDPSNPLWAEMLGYVRFKRGGWDMVDAKDQMMAALDAGTSNLLPYVVASEAFRRLGNAEDAAALPRKGLMEHPDDLAMLNNLVYTLSLTADGLDEAMDLLPQLEKRAEDNPHVWDTLAVAYLAAGRINDAEKATLRVVKMVGGDNHPLRFRAETRLAAVEFNRGQHIQAAARLEKALGQTAGIDQDDLFTARSLQAEAEAALTGKRD